MIIQFKLKFFSFLHTYASVIFMAPVRNALLVIHITYLLVKPLEYSLIVLGANSLLTTYEHVYVLSMSIKINKM